MNVVQIPHKLERLLGKKEVLGMVLGEKSKSRNNNINLIQFIAAVLVIYGHAFPIATAGNSGEIIKDLTQSQYSFGNLAVAIFFIFSGYLVCGSWERSQSLYTYARNRFYRIFPELAGVIVLSVLVLGPVFTKLSLSEYFTSATTWTYFKNLLLYPLYWDLPGVFESNLYGASVNGSLWTIPYQVLLYALLGIMGVIGLLKHKKASAFVFVLFALGHFFKGALWGTRTHFMLMPLSDLMYLGMYFMAGVLAWQYREQITLNRQGAMLSITLLLLCFYLKEYFFSMAVFGTYICLYLSYCTPYRSFRLSRLSYGVYIYGFPIQQMWTAIFGGKMNPYLNIVLSLPCVVLLAWLSDRLIERPALRLKEQLRLTELIPDRIKSAWEKLKVSAQRVMTDYVLNPSWILYGVVVVLCCAYVYFFRIYAPSGINFADPPGFLPDHIYDNGWHEQEEGQDFCFVSDSSTITLHRNTGANKLSVVGFVPDNFTDITMMTVLCNGVCLGTQDLTSNKGIMLEYQLDGYGFATSGNYEVQLIFNGTHQWLEGEADQRKLSACIMSIAIE